MPNALLDFINTAIGDLENGQADAVQLKRDLDGLDQELEGVENQYAFAPEEEEALRLALLHSVRLYQHCLDLLRRYLEFPHPDLLERARAAAEEASLHLEEVEEASQY